MTTKMKDPLEAGTPAKRSFPIYQILATVGVSMCSAITGFTGGYSSPALDSLSQPNSKIHVTNEDKSWIGSLLPLASLVGSLAAGISMTYLGRRLTLMGSCPFFILAYVLTAFSVNVAMIFTGRSIAGFLTGMVTVIFPVYLGESLDPEVRGRLGIMPTVFGNAGFVIAYAVGAVLDWSMLAMFGAFFSLPFVIIMIFVPESPRWYVSKGKVEKAKKSAQKLRGKDADVEKELEDLIKIDEEDKKAGDFKELLRKRYLSPLAICIGLMFFQQLCGINAFLYYVVEIFKTAGSSINASLCSVIVGLVNAGATISATFLIDKVGRKLLLYVSFALMSVTLVTFGAYFYAKEHGSDVSFFGWLPLLCLMLYVVGFSIGAGPIPWLMMGELLPVKIRNAGASLITCVNFFLSFVVSKTYHELSSAIKPYGAIWIYALVSLVGIIFVFTLVPETRGRTLEDIQRKFMTLDEEPLESIDLPTKESKKP